MHTRMCKDVHLAHTRDHIPDHLWWAGGEWSWGGSCSKQGGGKQKRGPMGPNSLPPTPPKAGLVCMWSPRFESLAPAPLYQTGLGPV